MFSSFGTDLRSFLVFLQFASFFFIEQNRICLTIDLLCGFWFYTESYSKELQISNLGPIDENCKFSLSI